MALDGIPIPDTQEIGDSLPFINNSFLSLDTRLESASSVLTTNLATASSSLTTALTSLSSVLTIDIASLSSLQSTLIPASATFVSKLTATSLTLTTNLTALSSSIDQWNTDFNVALATKPNLSHTHNLSDIITGNSVYFNGTTDFLSASNSLSAFNINKSNGFTIECWIFPFPNDIALPAEVGVVRRVIAGVCGDSNTRQQSWVLSQNTTSTLTQSAYSNVSFHFAPSPIYSFNSASGVPYYAQGPANSLKILRWNHVAVSCSNAGIVTVYVNGMGGTPVDINATTTSTGDLTGPLNPFANAPLTLGRGAAADTEYFVGHISNFRFVQNQSLYSNNFVPPTSNLSVDSQGALSNNTKMLCLTKDQSKQNLFKNLSPHAPLFSEFLEPVGSPTINPISPFSPPYVNKGIYFTGPRTYFSIPHSSNWNVGGVGTIEMWLNINWAGDTKVLLNQYVSDTNKWEIKIDNALLSFAVDNTNIVSYEMPLATTDDRWIHVAFTTNGTNMNMFINGIIVSTASYTTTTNVVSPLYIGRLPDTVSTTNHYNGFYISNLRIVRGQVLYNDEFQVPTSPLTTTSQGASPSNVRLLTLQDLNLADNCVDNSPSQNILTRVGIIKSVGTNPFNSTSTLNTSFDGPYTGSGVFNNSLTRVFSLKGPTLPGSVLASKPLTLELWFFINGNKTNPLAAQTTREMVLLSMGSGRARSDDKWSISITGSDTEVGTGIRVDVGANFPGTSTYAPSLVVAGITTIASYTGPIEKYKWHHIALVCVPTGQPATSYVELFLNGMSVSKTFNPPQTVVVDFFNFPSATDLYVGGSYLPSNLRYNFKGLISNYRATKQALYTQNFVPSRELFTTTSQGALPANVLNLFMKNFSVDDIGYGTFMEAADNDIYIDYNNTPFYTDAVQLQSLLNMEADLTHVHSQSSIVDLYKINSALTSNNLLSGEIINFNVLDQTTFYYPNSASGPFSLNIRGNNTTPLSTILNIGESTKISFLNTTRLSASGLSSLRIDNVPQTVRWLNGITPTPTLCSTNLWEFNIFEMPVAAFGTTGTVNNYGVFGSMKRYNSFPLTANALVVAGGASGGGFFGVGGGGGGGGAGGYRLFTDHLFEPGATYLVIVGAGGFTLSRFNGGDSTITTTTSAYGPVYISTGGGAGGILTSPYSNPSVGGSGGGAGADATPATGTSVLAGAAGNTPSTIPAQGFAGGSSYADASPGLNRNGGGGGGSAAVGGNATAAAGGAGGAGVSVTVAGVAKNVAGGGGGGVGRTGGAAAGGAGGLGGGGAGGGASTAPVAGTANTGGGGGGAGNVVVNSGLGNNGGSGIIQIWYAGTVERAIGGTITKPAGFVLHTFNSSGIFTVL